MLARAASPSWGLAALVMLAARHALAVECAPPSGLSTCIDADPVWLAPRSSLFFVASRDRGPLTSLELALTHRSRPIALRAPAPDPQGREIPVMKRELGASVLASHSLSRRVTLDLVLPLVVEREGPGIEGATSSNAPPPPQSSLRDPRAGVSFELLELRAPVWLAVASRFDLSLPAGDERHFAGERSAVGQPSMVVTWRRGPAFAASATGVRLRQPVQLADARFGTSLWVAVGAGISVIGESRLVAALEAYLMPSLVGGPGTGHARDRSESLVPAEWMLSLRARVHPLLTARLGTGTGLPLSTRATPSGGVDHYAAPTIPAWRATGSLTLTWPRSGASVRRPE